MTVEDEPSLVSSGDNSQQAQYDATANQELIKYDSAQLAPAQQVLLQRKVWCTSRLGHPVIQSPCIVQLERLRPLVDHVREMINHRDEEWSPASLPLLSAINRNITQLLRLNGYEIITSAADDE